MNEKILKEIVEKQIDNFLYAGDVAIELRNKGLNIIFSAQDKLHSLITMLS